MHQINVNMKGAKALMLFVQAVLGRRRASPRQARVDRQRATQPCPCILLSVRPGHHWDVPRLHQLRAIPTKVLTQRECEERPPPLHLSRYGCLTQAVQVSINNNFF